MPRSRLSDADRAELIARYRDGATAPDLAAAFGVPLSTVRYHTAGVVRPAVAARHLRTLQRELARHTPESVPVLLPAATEATDADPAAPDTYILVSPAQRRFVRKRWRDGATPEALAAVVGVSADAIAAVVAGIPRSRGGAQRVTARVAAQRRTQRGYPKLHPGASAVRITPVRGGVELRISRELYRKLGAPERLDVARHGTRLLLRPGTRYGVVIRDRSGMHRITLGAAARAALGLGTTGRFRAR